MNPAAVDMPGAGVMGVVTTGGVVRPGDEIVVTLPSGPHLRLIPV